MKDAKFWAQCSENAQQALQKNFWNAKLKRMNAEFPCKKLFNNPFHYWWHAHVIDVYLDGYERTKDPLYLEKVQKLLEGVLKNNSGTLINLFYDDMEWMALALLRAYDVSGNELYKQYVLELWEDIKTAWNSNMGGGMAWKKDQLDYKNTPANAPASILASRLYQHFGKEEDLEFAKRIYHWTKDNLVDPHTGFVWDGMNRLGDGKIDKEWEFTYCQGVFIGAGLELYSCTQSLQYLEDAKRTAQIARQKLASKETNILKSEGYGDGGLFKGILVRYLTELLKVQWDLSEISEMLETNALALYERGTSAATGLFGQYWGERPEGTVSLSAHLSGMMLLEAVALLKK
jgi:predicted alpha-1,6-mannanase (GH76 family)